MNVIDLLIFSFCFVSVLFQSNVSAPSPAKKTSQDGDFLNRTKQMLERLFPNIPSKADDNDDIWLTNVTKHIEQHIQQQNNEILSQNKQLKQQSIENNSHQNGNHCSDNGTTISSSDEELLLQNAKLKTTVDEYKTIISETVRYHNHNIKYRQTVINDFLFTGGSSEAFREKSEGTGFLLAKCGAKKGHRN